MSPGYPEREIGVTPGIFPMCWRGPQSHSRAMNTNDLNPQAITNEPESDTEPKLGHQPERVLLRRSYDDRMLGGVAGGLAHYFGVDAVIVRIAFVVLAFVGGAGLPLYLAGLLLIPEEGSDTSIASSIIESVQTRSR
jgi:phage shock protein PspC (stress-responsive transcriptional regulator)